MGESGTSGTSGTGFNTVSNPADNRVLTSDGTTNAAVAESNLTFNGTILNITRTSGNGSLYGTGDLVLETDSTFYIGAYTARPLYINSANGASGTVYVSSAGLLGVGTTSPAANVDINNTGNATLRLKGAGTGYTHGAIILQSGTTDIPEVRGLGVYTFNEGADATWYIGTGYQYGDTFLISRKAGTSLDPGTASPAEAYPFISISNIGNIGINVLSPGYKIDLDNGALGTTAGNQSLVQRFKTTSTNADYLEITNTRTANGSDWYSSGYRIQQIVDTSWMGYIQFNGGNLGGLSIGAGITTTSATSVTQVMSINVGTVDITGVLTATIKSFVIDHPTKPGMKLQYGVLEGPEHSVYVRGKLVSNDTIVLPDHWVNLVHEDSITVNLTPIGKHQNLYVDYVDSEKIIIKGEENIHCYYTVFAERKDVDKLKIEY
jgi:hypothetical protein